VARIVVTIFRDRFLVVPAGKNRNGQLLHEHQGVSAIGHRSLLRRQHMGSKISCLVNPQHPWN
jgi:hypothetical protein